MWTRAGALLARLPAAAAPARLTSAALAAVRRRGMTMRAPPPPSAAEGGGHIGLGVRGNGGTRTPFALGAAGLLPFLFWGAQHDKIDSPAPPQFDALVASAAAASGLPLGFFLSGDQETVRRRFVSYGACILSFMAAVQWGLAMAAPVYLPWAYVGSVLPSLWAWGALNADARTVTPHSMLATGFVGVYFVDEILLRKRLAPSWYGVLRAPLTVVVTMTIVLAAYAGRVKKNVYNSS
jgi:hypothetical protein